MKIIVDGEGGDKAPSEILKGCAMAVQELGDVDLIVTGHVDLLKETAEKENISLAHIEFADATDTLTMEDSPESVVRAKKNSSMGVALKLLADRQAEAMVTAGNSGAVLFGGSLLVRRIKGVKRAAFAPILPTKTGYALLLDSGATVDGRPEFLEQYGVLGSEFMKAVYGVQNPKVGLANNGTEECKGTDLYKEAHALLKNNPYINFIGNVEGRDLMTGTCDVFVADGFTGNLILKSVEGMGLFLLGEIKNVFYANLKTKLAALMLKKQLSAFKKKADYKETGGAIVLGLTKPVVKAHGSSDARAFKNSIRLAYRTASTDMINSLSTTFSAMKEE